MDGVTAEVKNTCSFDSICQIIALMYSESENFRSLMGNTKNAVIQTSKSLALYGATTNTYILRCKALAMILKGENLQKPTANSKSSTNFVRYECFGNICNLVRQLFQDMPSMSVVNSCYNTLCTKKLKLKIKKYITLEVNGKILLTNGLPSIELAVTDWIKNLEKPCCEKAYTNPTMGSIIFVETDFLGIEGVEMIYGATDMYNRSSAIKEIPIHEEINSEKFTLRGVVAHFSHRSKEFL